VWSKHAGEPSQKEQLAPLSGKALLHAKVRKLCFLASGCARIVSSDTCDAPAHPTAIIGGNPALFLEALRYLLAGGVVLWSKALSQPCGFGLLPFRSS